MKQIPLFLLLVTCLYGSCQTTDHSADFTKMEWLLGTWKGEADGFPFFEHWEKINGTEFRNTNFSFCNGDTVTGGRSKIEIRNNKIAYTSGNATWELKQLTGNQVIFENTQFREKFTFTRTEKGEWNAVLQYPSANTTYTLAKTTPVAGLLQSRPAPVQAHYAGNIEFNNKKLYTEIDFSVQNGVQVAHTTTPGNLQLDQPFQSVCFDPPFVKLTIQDGTRTLRLHAKIENDRLTGKLTGEIPATIALEKKGTVKKHSQKNYTIERTKITNGETSLAANLFLPRSGKPVGAVIMICGTGQHSKEEYNGWADLLASKGVAVLAYDKRNVTQFPAYRIRRRSSDIVLPGMLESDVAAAIKLLKGKKEIDPHKIGLLGFSQGAVIAPVVAAGNNDVAFVVAISGNVTTDKEFIINQSLNRLKQRNTNAGYITEANQIWERLFQYVKDRKDGSGLQQQIDNAYEKGFGQSVLPRQIPNEDEIKYLTTWNGFEHDPAVYYTRIRVPVYAVFGQNDQMIPVDRSVQILGDVFANKKELLTTKLYANSDHFIKTLPDRNDFDFPKFAMGYIEDLAGWISKKGSPWPGHH